MIQNKGSNYHKSAFYEDKSANIVSYRTPNFATFNCIISNILTYLGDGELLCIISWVWIDHIILWSRINFKF